MRSVDVFRRFVAERKEEPNWGERFINNTKTQLFLLIVTLYALFFDDYRFLTSDKSLDYSWDISNNICIVVFLLEILISLIFIPKYVKTHYLYLDILSTLSMVLDHSYIKSRLRELSQKRGTSFDQLTKLFKLIRLFRLIRISKIYKSFSNRASSIKNDSSSKVGKELSQMATKSVIVICYLMIIFLPFFNSDFWMQGNETLGTICQSMTTLVEYKFASFPENLSELRFDASKVSLSKELSTASFADSFQDMAGLYISDLKETHKPLVFISFKREEDDSAYFKSDDFESYRFEELNSFSCETKTSAGVAVEIYLSQAAHEYTIIENYLDILRTIYICFILIGGSWLFSSKTNGLVIRPIENIMERITKIIGDPQRFREIMFIEQERQAETARLALYKEDDEEGFDEMDLSTNEFLEEHGLKKKEQKHKHRSLETKDLEDSVRKIGMLLGVVFGEAGTQLIEDYLSAEGNNSIMSQQAEQIEAVYGFCDIRNFTDATEVLQQGVMVFVNKIADIVHTITDQTLGSANKNVGDAFLIVWKLTRQRIVDANRFGTDIDRVYTNLSDMALYSIMKIFAEINRSFSLTEYVNNQELKRRIGNNYKVKLGFGLHLGWAIEGSIGSHFKIDVSYLSPHVNMAGKLESICKQYGVAALLSGDFYDKLSFWGKKFCRKIDVVWEKNNSTPLRIYCIDILDRAIKFPQYRPLKDKQYNSQQRYSLKTILEREIASGVLVGQAIFQNDVDVALLTSFVDQVFNKKFSVVMDAYEKGEFKTAIILLEKLLDSQQGEIKDGPSMFLLNFMKSNPNAMKKWRGGREEDGGGH